MVHRSLLEGFSAVLALPLRHGGAGSAPTEPATSPGSENKKAEITSLYSFGSPNMQWEALRERLP